MAEKAIAFTPAPVYIFNYGYNHSHFLRRAEECAVIAISKSKLKAHMLRIFREIEQSGEELVVTDHNRPVLRILPISGKKAVEEAFGSVRGDVIYKEDINTPTQAEWEAV